MAAHALGRRDRSRHEEGNDHLQASGPGAPSLGRAVLISALATLVVVAAVLAVMVLVGSGP